MCTATLPDYDVAAVLCLPVYFVYAQSTVHDMENLTFPADDRVDIPHIAARPSAYVCADNQRIPRRHLEDSARTISGFCAEQLADSVRNSANVRQR